MLAILVLALCLLVCQAEVSEAAPMGTAFTHQGRLIDANNAADGLYDFQFKLYDDPNVANGNQVGPDVNVPDVDVIDGYFTVELDFGSVYDGEARWLEIGVRPSELGGPNVYTTLAPRQRLTPAPQSIVSAIALYALNSDRVDGYHAGNSSGQVAVSNKTVCSNLNADMVDGQHASSFLGPGSDYGRPGVSSVLYESTTALVNKYLGRTATATNADRLDGQHGSYYQSASNINSGTLNNAHFSARSDLSSEGYLGNASGDIAQNNGTLQVNLNADMVDGLHASGFASSAHDHDTRYYTESESDGRFVYKGGDHMTGSLEVAFNNPDYAVKGIGHFGPTNGYLGIQGTDDFDTVSSADWDGDEVGVIGISTGGTASDNYGVLGHSNGAGVRGEYSGNPTNDYGELGKNGYGVYAKGSSYAGYFDGRAYISDRVGIGTTDLYAQLNVEGSGLSYSLNAEWDGSSLGAAILAKNTGTGGDAIQALADGSGRSAIRARGSSGVEYAIYADASGADWAGFFDGEVKVDGNIHIYDGTTKVMELGAGLDYAEGFDVSEASKIDAGSVLIIDADNPGKLAVSNKAYDTKVAGIVAGAKGLSSGVRLGAGEYDYNVALAGRVYCNVDTTEAPVEPGDLLTTSVTAGYAMKATDYTRAQGAILGKAMEKLEKGLKGQILVLVTLQ